MIFSGIVTLAILPFGNVQDGLGLYGIDVSIGVLYFFAFSSLSFYGLLLAGWSSGSKYSFLGAMRSAAQLISYEVSMGLALLGVVMMTGSLSLTHVVDGQGAIWNIVPQIVGFLIFMVAGFAETNRAPFDLPEADAELVQGYMTEYGGMRFGSYLLAEYLEMFVVSGIAVTFFLGGWMGPGPGWLDPVWMVAKTLDAGLLLHLGPGHPAAPSLRPAHVAGLEGDAAAGDAEHPRHRRDRDGELMQAKLNTEKTDWSEFPYLESHEDVISVQRGPKPGGAGGAYRAFGETLRGLRTTFGRVLEGPVTIQYQPARAAAPCVTVPSRTRPKVVRRPRSDSPKAR